jgi:hypothetical protein
VRSKAYYFWVGTGSSEYCPNKQNIEKSSSLREASKHSESSLVAETKELLVFSDLEQCVRVFSYRHGAQKLQKGGRVQRISMEKT